MRLTTTGLVLLLTSVMFQLCLIVGFCIINRESECYPLRAIQDKELIDGITTYFLLDFATLRDIKNSSDWHKPLDHQSEKHLERLKQVSEDLKQKYRDFSTRRTPIAFFPDVQKMQSVKKDFDGRCVWLDTLTSATEKAFELSRQIEVRTDKEEAKRQRETAYQTANGYLIGLANYHENQALAPRLRVKERHTYRLLLVLLSSANLLALLIVGWLFCKKVSKRINLVVDNVERMKNGSEPSSITVGTDEIKQLDLAFSHLFRQLNETMQPYKAMMENSQDLLCSCDLSGKIVLVSDSSIPLLGYTPAELKDTWLMELVQADCQTEAAKLLIGAGSLESSSVFETQLTRDDGTAFDARLSAKISPKSDRIYVVAQDITQRKAADRLQQELIHMVSHDLKTPLNAISNFHELLETNLFGTLELKSLEQVGRAKRSTDRMLRLVRDLLDVERMHSGMLELDKNDTEIDTVIRTAIETLQSLADSKGVTLKAMPCRCRIIADADRLMQILVNLISNAIKFSSTGSSVIISAEQDEKFTRMFVTDHGRGIPADHLQSIFEPFNQVEVEDATKFGGSGLGLSICCELTKLHGGNITVDSVLGQGSTFCVELPNL